MQLPYLRLFIIVLMIFATLSGCVKNNQANQQQEAESDTSMEMDNDDTTMNEQENTMMDDASHTYAVVSSESTLQWEASRIVGSSHAGAVDLANGSLAVSDGQLIGGEFVIDMTTISETTMEEGQMKDRFLGHVASDDFFAVEDYPQSTFVITAVEPASGEATHMISGDLTIRGITHSIVFPATVVTRDGVIEAQAQFNIDRTKWDVVFDSGSVFTSLGEKAIKDEITYSVSIVARDSAAMSETN